MTGDDTGPGTSPDRAVPPVPGQPVLWRIGEGVAPGRPHAALVPGTQTPLLALDLPPRLRGAARDQVGRRMLAEKLSVQVGQVEIRPVRRRGAMWSRAVVADAADLRRWRDELSARCVALLPDFAALPCVPRVWTLAIEGGQVRARLGIEDGFTAEPALAAMLLKEAAASGKPAAILRLGAVEETLDAALGPLGAPLFADLAALSAAGHGRPLKWSEAVRGFDLMVPPDADFTRLHKRIRGWAAPALVAALALAIWLGAIAMDTRRMEQQAAAARADAEAMVRAHFVAGGPILDIRAQVAGALEEMRARSPRKAADPLILFQRAAPFLAGAPTLLQAVSYREDTGLVADVEMTDFAALDALIADLRGAGFDVEGLDSGARQSGGVSARLRLREAEG